MSIHIFAGWNLPDFQRCDCISFLTRCSPFWLGLLNKPVKYIILKWPISFFATDKLQNISNITLCLIMQLICIMQNIRWSSAPMMLACSPPVFPMSTKLLLLHLVGINLVVQVLGVGLKSLSSLTACFICELPRSWKEGNVSAGKKCNWIYICRWWS